jgi:hypothetical protein
MPGHEWKGIEDDPPNKICHLKCLLQVTMYYFNSISDKSIEDGSDISMLQSRNEASEALDILPNDGLSNPCCVL